MLSCEKCNRLTAVVSDPVVREATTVHCIICIAEEFKACGNETYTITVHILSSPVALTAFFYICTQQTCLLFTDLNVNCSQLHCARGHCASVTRLFVKHDGDSNENFKIAIKIRNTARFSCKLATFLRMVWRVADRWQCDTRMQYYFISCVK
jgi:hypothetical protein